MSKKQTQEIIILNALIENALASEIPAGITGLEFVNGFGILSYTSRIARLRKNGYVIKDRWVSQFNRRNEICDVKAYYIPKEFVAEARRKKIAAEVKHDQPKEKLPFEPFDMVEFTRNVLDPMRIMEDLANSSRIGIKAALKSEG